MIVHCIPVTPITGRLPGDRMVRRGMELKHYRGTTLVATYPLASASELTEDYFFGAGAVGHIFLEEHPVEAVAVTCTSVNLSGENYNFQFGAEGTPRTLEQLEAELVEMQSVEMAQKIQRVKAYANSNGGADMTLQVGVACTIDFRASNPISFSE